MTTRELKIIILGDIQAIKEDGILLIIKSILDTYKNDTIIISDKRKKIPDEAKQQIKNNEYFTDDEINADI
ncbi:MAG: hypothetical protein WAT71_02235 [Ignavibacteria bacterium]